MSRPREFWIKPEIVHPIEESLPSYYYAYDERGEFCPQGETGREIHVREVVKVKNCGCDATCLNYSDEDTVAEIAQLRSELDVAKDSLRKIRTALTTQESKVEFYTKKEAQDALICIDLILLEEK